MSSLRALEGFTSAHFRSLVSKRAYTRGVQFAMEGFVSGVTVQADDSGFVLEGQCFASFAERIKRKVRVELGKKPIFKAKAINPSKMEMARKLREAIEICDWKSPIYKSKCWIFP